MSPADMVEEAVGIATGHGADGTLQAVLGERLFVIFLCLVLIIAAAGVLSVELLSHALFRACLVACLVAVFAGRRI